jgi:hypothetical protein
MIARAHAGSEFGEQDNNGDNPVKTWLGQQSGCVDYPRLDSWALRYHRHESVGPDDPTIAGAHVDIIPWSRNSQVARASRESCGDSFRDGGLRRGTTEAGVWH